MNKRIEILPSNKKRGNDGMKLKFTKMHGCGNDYIYFDCFDQTVEHPEALAVK